MEIFRPLERELGSILILALPYWLSGLQVIARAPPCLPAGPVQGASPVPRAEGCVPGAPCGEVLGVGLPGR